VTDAKGRDQMADVWRVERAAEQPDARGNGQRGHNLAL